MFKFSPSEKICSLTFDFSKKIKHITRAKHEYHYAEGVISLDRRSNITVISDEIEYYNNVIPLEAQSFTVSAGQ